MLHFFFNGGLPKIHLNNLLITNKDHLVRTRRLRPIVLQVQGVDLPLFVPPGVVLLLHLKEDLDQTSGRRLSAELHMTLEMVYSVELLVAPLALESRLLVGGEYSLAE